MLSKWLKRGKHSTARRPTMALGPSWGAFLVIAVVIMAAAGCSSRGEIEETLALLPEEEIGDD